MSTIIRITGFVQRYWFMLLLAFLCIIVGTGFGIIVPIFLGDGIDTVLSMGQRSAIVIAATVIVVAMALRGLAGYGQRFFAEVVAQKATYNIRNALYQRLQRLSFSFHDRNQTGQLMSRATVDVEIIRMFFAMGLLGMTQVVFMTVGVTYVLLASNWSLGLMTLAFCVPLAWVAATFGRRIRPIWLKVQAMMGFMGNTLEESLSGAAVVKAFSHQKEEGRKFADQAQSLYDDSMAAARLMSINMPTMILLVSLPTVLILWYGGHLVVDGSMTIGEVTQFILLVGMLMMPMRRLGMMVNLFSRTVSAGQRILEILDTESDVKEKHDAIDLGKAKGKVTFENVSFSYNSLGAALKDISFEVQPGQLVALLGRSGSGKSTIANLLARFYDVTGGRILIDGTDIRDVTLASLRKNVVTAQQDVFLFSATIKENIAYGAKDASMDAETEKLIRQALDRLIKGRTTFIITHRVPIIQNADLILVLDNGELVERGTHKELLAKKGLYKEVYESQLLTPQGSEESPEG
jgi:ABC-type multidrug transport system fused ATPase/permease subunit